MSSEISQLNISLEQAIKIVLNALKLRLDFEAALACYFKEYPEGQSELFDYVKNRSISFDTLPHVVKAAIVAYSHSIQKIAETDLYYLREKSVNVGDGRENEDLEFNSSVPIQPTAYLGMQKQVLSIDEGPEQGLSGFSSLRILTETGYPVDSPTKDSRWSLFFDGFKNLLEFLGQQEANHIAVIDNCDFVNDARHLSRLAGYLRLYGWEPLLMVDGSAFPERNQVLKCLNKIAGGSIVHFQLCLDYLSLQQIGVHVLCEILKDISSAVMSMTIFYALDSEPKSRELLQRLLADPDFNHLCPSVSTEMREKRSVKIVPKYFRLHRSSNSFTELNIDLMGAVRLFFQEHPVAGEVKLSGSHWKNQILGWHHLYGNRLNYA